MTNKTILFTIYKIVLFICALQSFGCSIFWGLSNIVSSISLASIGGILTLFNVKTKQYKRNGNVIWFVIYIFSLVFTQSNNFIGWLFFFFIAFNLFVLFTFDNETKHNLYSFFHIGLAILVGVSLIGWGLYLVGVPLPHYSVGYGSDSSMNGYQYYFDNYYFFLLNQDTVFRYIIPRFSAVFLEPGYLGCLMSILLFSDRFQFGKGHRINFIFLVALIMSFSLAGWLLALFAFIMNRLSTQSGRVFWLLFIIVTISFGANFFRDYKNGNNIVNESILMRLEYDKQDSSIAGYNRSSESLDYFFWNTFIHSEDLAFGNRQLVETYSTSAENEVSWTAYIINYGLIAFFILLLYFFFPTINAKNHRFDKFCTGILYFVIFSQTTHMTHSLLYVSLFVTIIGNIDFQTTTLAIKNK